MKRHWAPIYNESEKPLCGRPRKPRPLIEEQLSWDLLTTLRGAVADRSLAVPFVS